MGEIVLYINGLRHVAERMHPSDSLADYLHCLGLRGTKVGCEQGGCGACSVILTYWDVRTKTFRHKTVNSCLVPLVYADHTAILTIEGIGNTKNPHIIQQLIANNNASQCGYCTPGFVMAIYGKLLNKEADETMIQAVASNLCRCTGYRPITETVRQIERMGIDVAYPYNLPDELKVEEIHYSFENRNRFVDRASQVYSTSSMFEMLKLKQRIPDIKIANGFSELLVVRSDHNSRMKETINTKYLVTWRVYDMIHMISKDDGVHIGVNMTINDVKHAILTNEEFKNNPRLFALASRYERFASMQVRNCATIGGNVCHGSPVSDTLPVLYSSNAVMVAISLKSEYKDTENVDVAGMDCYNFRYIPISCWMKRYLTNALESNEVLYEIIIPHATEDSFSYYDIKEPVYELPVPITVRDVKFWNHSYKFSRRFDDDIAVIGGDLELGIQSEPFNGNFKYTIRHFRLTYSAMAITTIRLENIEKIAEEQFNIFYSNDSSSFDAILKELLKAISSRFTLDINVAGGMAMYRSEMAKNIVCKFMLEALKKFNITFSDSGDTIYSKLLKEDPYEYEPIGVQEYANYYEGKEEDNKEQEIENETYKKLSSDNSITNVSGVNTLPPTIDNLTSFVQQTTKKHNMSAFGRSVVHQSALQQATGEATYLSTMREIFNYNEDNAFLEQVDENVTSFINDNTCLYMYPIYAATSYGRIMNIEAVKKYYNQLFSLKNEARHNKGYFRILTATDVPNFNNKTLNKNTGTFTTHPSNPTINRVSVGVMKDEPVLMTDGDDILAPSEMIAIVVSETMRSSKMIAAQIRTDAIIASTKEELEKGMAQNDGSTAPIKLVIDTSDLEKDKLGGNVVRCLDDYFNYVKEAETDPKAHFTMDYLRQHYHMGYRELYYSQDNKYRDTKGLNLTLKDMKAQHNTNYKNDEFMKLFEVDGLQVVKEDSRVFSTPNAPRSEESYTIYYSQPNGREDPYCIIESTLDIHHQEHFYFETHCTLASVDNAHYSNVSVVDDMRENDAVKNDTNAIEHPKGTVTLTTTTQNVSAVVNNVSNALSIPVSRVTVNICNNRIGGGFGGKESTFQQQTACALAAIRSSSDGVSGINHPYRPVYTQNSRTDDLRYTGKRHPFKFFNLMRVNLKTMKIEAFQVIMFCDAGYCLDLSLSVLERAVFHASNSYYIPNVKVIGHVIRSRSNSNTAFRGFGAPQAVLNIETLMERLDNFKKWYWRQMNASASCSLDQSESASLNPRLVNMLRSGDILPYGGAVFGVTLQRMLNSPLNCNNKKYATDVELSAFEEMNNEQPCKKLPGQNIGKIYEPPLPMRYVRDSSTVYNDTHSLLRQYEEMKHEYELYNRTHTLSKRGVGLVPVTFGVTFTQRFLNQSTAIVTLDKDGSFAISHCGIEMGQGIDTKMRQLAAKELGVDYSMVTVQSPSSALLPNGPPTSASSAADLNGYAIIKACDNLKETLKDIIAEVSKEAEHVNWSAVANTAFIRRIPLTFMGHYSSPCQGYDFNTHTGTPFAYYSFSAVVLGVEVDALTGEYKVLRAGVCVDVGSSTNPGLDIGQIEGAFVQGMGFVNEDFIMLDVYRRSDGKLIDRLPLSSGPGNYKIPSILDIPESFSVALLAGSRNPRAPHSGKGLGEPPLCLGTVLMVALQDAVNACYDVPSPQLMHPCTMESVKDCLKPAPFGTM